MVFYDDQIFVGFACLISYKDITHIIYIAISEKLRDKGYGHKTLELIKDIRPNNRFIVDIEEDEVDCINHDMRKRRMLFYMHDAFSLTNIKYQYKGVSYQIMSARGDVSQKEFLEFWEHFSNKDDLGYYISKHFLPK